MIDPTQVLLFKIFLISGFVTLILWVVQYVRYSRGKALWDHDVPWNRQVGLTLVAKTMLIACLFVPSVLALFFHLSARTSHEVGWVNVTMVGLVTPVMCWRIYVWRCEHIVQDQRRALEARNGDDITGR